jgi:hypothetical protein
MSRGAIVIIAFIIAALFGVVFLTSGDQPTENTPDTRYEVPAPGGTQEVPAERQTLSATPPAATP